jgi:hypothetical protein
MVLSLIFNTLKYAKSGFFDARTNAQIVSFDTMISEDHKYTSKVTSYPVEQGTIVSDHILKYPVTVSLSGYVTDTPLSFLQVLASFNRSTAVFERLVQLFENRSIFDVVTGIKVYKNMTITKLEVPRTVKTGQTLTFNIELQQIVFSDVLNQPLSLTNIFVGTQTIRSSEIIRETTDIAVLQFDPPTSLKDEASTNVNQGVQTLAPIPEPTRVTTEATYQVIKNGGA